MPPRTGPAVVHAPGCPHEAVPGAGTGVGMSNAIPAPALAARKPMLALLTLGPVATVIALMAGVTLPTSTPLGAAPLSTYLIVALLAWSPLPLSLPAVFLERARDEALPGYTGLGRLVRGALLVPYMVTRSPWRVEFLASLVGFAIAVAVAWPYVA